MNNDRNYIFSLLNALIYYKDIIKSPLPFYIYISHLCIQTGRCLDMESKAGVEPMIHFSQNIKNPECTKKKKAPNWWSSKFYTPRISNILAQSPNVNKTIQKSLKQL